MRSMHSDLVRQPNLELVLVLASAVVQLPLVAAGLGLSGSHLQVLGFGAAASIGIAVAVGFSSHNGQRLAHMVLFMLLFGNLGMLIGASMDFGDQALIGLTHWCHMHPGLDLSTVGDKLSGAPWSYGLMLAGCNLGMLLSDWTWHRRSIRVAVTVQRGNNTYVRSLRCYLGCNVGMLAGMLLAEGMMPGGHHHHHVEVGGVLTMVAMMATGMTIGMLIGLRLSFGLPLVRRGRIPAS